MAYWLEHFTEQVWGLEFRFLETHINSVWDGTWLVIQALEGGITKVAILLNSWFKFETLVQ